MSPNIWPLQVRRISVLTCMGYWVLPPPSNQFFYLKGEISMQRRWARTTALSLWLALALGFVSSSAMAQYKLTNLTSNQTGKAKHVDPLLQNAWGLVYAPAGPFWVSDEWDGWSTLYNGAGVPQKLQVTVPPASGSGLSPGAWRIPTGRCRPKTAASDDCAARWRTGRYARSADRTANGPAPYRTSPRSPCACPWLR